MLYTKDSFANHSHGEHRSIACKSPGSLRQMDIADKCLWSTISLGWLPRGSKLHVMLLFECIGTIHTCA